MDLMTMAVDGAAGGFGLEQLLGVFGLNVTRVLGINFVCALIKGELKDAGLWVPENPIKRHFAYSPLVIAVAFCWFFEKQPPGWVGVVSAAECGLIYGIAAIALFSLKRTSIDGR